MQRPHPAIAPQRPEQRSWVAAWLVIALALVTAACQTSTEIGQLGVGDGNTVAAGNTPSDIFEVARQSVVRIGGPGESRGSGVAIEGGWIITNAHVVDRSLTKKVITSDGYELGEVPVYAVDPVLDVAVLGPIPASDQAPVPIVQAVSADVRVGETVYLLGYPSEINTLPVPSLTAGIVNRRRHVMLGDYVFLQVDAPIAPGQSGGALVDSKGRFIGLSGIEFGSFGLALAVDSLNERVDELRAGPPLADLFAGAPVDSFEDVVGPHRFIGFITQSDGDIEIEVTSSGDTFIELLSPVGDRKFEEMAGSDYFIDRPRTESAYFSDRELQGTERLEVSVEPGPYQVLIGSFSASPAQASIVSATPLYPLPDLEEGAALTTGQIFEGEFGWTSDSDKWVVPLRAGDQARITIDGIADVFGVVRLGGQVIASDDDAAFGVFGLSALVEFTAETDGDYELEVGTRDSGRHGYLLQLEIS